MASQSPAASPLFLREVEIRRGVELMHFAHHHLMHGADGVLAREGLGRAHLRALYFIARAPGLAVGDLLGHLAITKQSLGRVLGELGERGLVQTSQGRDDRRQRLLRLTETGAALEAELFEELRSILSRAYSEAGIEAVAGFWAVLEQIVPESERARVARLTRNG